jgi:hypothetical protein
MSTTLTFILTIIGGALTFSIGQFIMKACLEPALELKRQIGKVAHDLDFYANQMHGDTPLAKEARLLFRKHACELREKLNTILWYSLLKGLLDLPAASSVREASSELIGHSNFPKQHDPAFDRTRDKEVKALLKIKT